MPISSHRREDSCSIVANSPMRSSSRSAGRSPVPAGWSGIRKRRRASIGPGKPAYRKRLAGDEDLNAACAAYTILQSWVGRFDAGVKTPAYRLCLADGRLRASVSHPYGKKKGERMGHGVFLNGRDFSAASPRWLISKNWRVGFAARLKPCPDTKPAFSAAC